MDITSANAVLQLTVLGLFPIPVQLQGFAADDIYDSDDVDAADTIMGADGKLSGGVVLAMIAQNIRFQADSPSIPIIDAWYQGQRAAIAVFGAQMNVSLTAVNTSYQCFNGILRRWKLLPDAKRVLQPRVARIEWESIIPIPIGAAG